MKAAELAPDNPKVMSNVALYLLASGQETGAQGLMTQQKLAPDVQNAIRADAQRIADTVRGSGHASGGEHAKVASR
jgi:Flp pilus assembly protein TadD